MTSSEVVKAQSSAVFGLAYTHENPALLEHDHAGHEVSEMQGNYVAALLALPIQQWDTRGCGPRLQDSSLIKVLHGAFGCQCLKLNIISKSLFLVTAFRANVENCGCTSSVNLAVWEVQAVNNTCQYDCQLTSW